MRSKRITWIWPCLVTLIVSGAYIGIRLIRYDFDPVALAEIGDRFAEQNPDGAPGYDGQFSYYIARNPDPRVVESYLDVPAYRYQRILYPILARMLGGGQEALIPWTLLAFNWIVHGLASAGICRIFHRRGVATGYALIYGLWVGLISAVGLDLHEPLAYGLVVGAWLMRENKRENAFACLLILALFAKETTLLFWFAALIPAWQGRSQNRSLLILISGGAFYTVWQLWLWRAFGAVGLGSGGDLASAFEWIPFMGLLRIGFVDWRVFGLFFLIFGPTVILPALWGLAMSWKARLQAFGDWSLGALLLHSLLIVFLPFSTFREPLGLVRVATGLVLAILIVASERKYKRVLNYGLFWIAMLAILIPQG